MGLYDKPESFRPIHWIWALGLALIYGVASVLTWSTGYIDFGDGNYMYISWRIAQGAVVYRDILAPQPPCHLFLGAGLVKLGDLLTELSTRDGLGFLAFDNLHLYVFRAFSMLLHIATYALVLRLAWRAWGRPATTILAGAIWLWLPINTWWSMGYQSEPLEIFFLLAMMAAALRVTAWGDLLAGIFAAGAGLTNATAAPFLLILILYMLFRAPLRALRMTAPCVLIVGVVVFLLQRWTEGAFMQNVVTNQVGTYPDTLREFIPYAINKLSGQGSNVLAMEGVFLALGLVGIWRYLASSPLDTVSCGGLGWFFVATLCSIIYVTKGGTEDYIFSLSEPAVAILAAGELAAWGRRWTAPLPEFRAGWVGVAFLPQKLVAAALLAIFALGPALGFHYQIRTQQGPYEMPAEAADRIVYLIKKNSAPSDTILSPPFYAFMAGRPIFGDYCELFIWQIKYGHDHKINDPEGEGWRKVTGIAEALKEKRIPIVVLDMDQPGMFPEIMNAMQENYLPLPSPLSVRGGPVSFIAEEHNTHLGFFVPMKERGAEALQQQHDAWRAFKFDLARKYGMNGVYLKFPWYDLKLTAMPEAPPASTPTPAPVKILPLRPMLRTPVTTGTATLTTGTVTLTTGTTTLNKVTSGTLMHNGTTSGTLLKNGMTTRSQGTSHPTSPTLNLQAVLPPFNR